ncbi:ubiquinol-cytochrome C chaperone family protein, partial [Escherichia coli]
FKSYKLTLIIANAILKALIGRGLSFGGNILLTRSMAILTGPIGWALTALWTLIDVGGAAYRVTIPAVIQIAALRSKVSNAGSEEMASEITLD